MLSPARSPSIFELVSWDSSVEEAVHRAALAYAPLRASASAVTHLGDTATRTAITVLAVAALLWRRARRSALFLGTVVPLGGLIDTLVKLAVNRARPVFADPITHAHGNSFPSGHALGAMVCYGALLLVVLPFLPPKARQPARWITGTIVAGVGLSRVVLGVHFPSDVLGGRLIGLGWLFLATVLFDLWQVESGRSPIEDPTVTGVEPEDAGRG
jgi:undecaprenyl-diphosphatase